MNRLLPKQRSKGPVVVRDQPKVSEAADQKSAEQHEARVRSEVPQVQLVQGLTYLASPRERNGERDRESNSGQSTTVSGSSKKN